MPAPTQTVGRGEGCPVLLVLTPLYPLASPEARAGFNALPFPSLHPQVLLLLPVHPLASFCFLVFGV